MAIDANATLFSKVPLLRSRRCGCVQPKAGNFWSTGALRQCESAETWRQTKNESFLFQWCDIFLPCTFFHDGRACFPLQCAPKVICSSKWAVVGTWKMRYCWRCNDCIRATPCASCATFVPSRLQAHVSAAPPILTLNRHAGDHLGL